MVGGPFAEVEIGGDRTADLFLLRFQTDGSLISHDAAAGVIKALPNTTDVFFFSHGWNNDFGHANNTYRTFISGYASQGAPGPHRKPLLVGVVWPSASFTMPWENGPDIAGDPTDAQREAGIVDAVEQALGDKEARRLQELLASAGKLDPADAREAAGLMLALFPDTGSEDVVRRPTPDEVLATWSRIEGVSATAPQAPDDFGEFIEDDPSRVESPETAGILQAMNPRNLLRIGTVWLMKDRAGKVGARGVAPLVRSILETKGVRLHLIGHSFGARVMLSATAFQPLPRKVRSMLLLQAAVNRWCFADNVAGTGHAGGYQPVLDRVQLPVLSTLSSHDLPLRQVFQLAMRGSHLGEPKIAALGDTDRYGALGGYGPAGVQAGTQPVRPPGQPYDLSGGSRIIPIDGGVSIDGIPAIGGHSDVNSPRTWWALRCLVQA